MLRIEFFQGYTDDNYILGQLSGLEYDIKCMYFNQDIVHFTYEAFESLVDDRTARYIIDIDFKSISIEKVRLNNRDISKVRYDNRVYKYTMQGEIEMFRLNNCGVGVQEEFNVQYAENAFYVSIYTIYNPNNTQNETIILQKLKEFQEFASINMQVVNNKTKKAIKEFKNRYNSIKQAILFEQNIVKRMKNLDM